MFGLMKAYTCRQPDEVRRNRRLHYCGTCKTLGGLYGQKTRALLNHDTVFLAEILSSIASDNQELSQWPEAIESFNCFRLPKTENHLPLPLQLAATATLVLAQFKIADHLKDSKQGIWKTARRLFAGDFAAAKARLLGWQFPFARLEAVLLSQEERETRALTSLQSADDILEDVAEPTAVATALFCGHGALLVGRPEAEASLYELGYDFGRLIYCLDAFEDYEKDRRQGNFNAIRAAYRINDSGLPAEVRREVIARLRGLARQLEARLHSLPMPLTFQELLVGRLRANLSRKIGALPVQQRLGKPSEHACRAKLPLADRARNAVHFSRQMSHRHQAEHPPYGAGRLAAPFLFVAVLPIAFFNPQQAMTATSYRECFSLGLNLMFFGAFFGSLPALFIRPWHSAAPNPGGPFPPPDANEGLHRAFDKAGRGHRHTGDNGSGWCDACDCCDCCDCTDCCDCSDGCNCCDGCDCS